MHQTVREFFPGSAFSFDLVKEFAKALETPAPFKYKIDLVFKKAEKFIDADTYLTSNQRLELAKMLIKRKYPWQKIQYSVSTVNHIANAFADYAQPIKERFAWIYDPPQLPINPNHKPSIATEYMKDFVGYYGPYAELVYLLTKGDFLKQDEWTNMPVHRFLYHGEYLLRKKRIETI